MRTSELNWMRKLDSQEITYGWELNKKLGIIVLIAIIITIVANITALSMPDTVLSFPILTILSLK